MEQFFPGGLSDKQADHLYMVQHQKYALIVDETGAVAFVHENCDYGIVKIPYLQSPYSIGLQKNSVYTKDVTMW